MTKNDILIRENSFQWFHGYYCDDERNFSVNRIQITNLSKTVVPRWKEFGLVEYYIYDGYYVITVTEYGKNVLLLKKL